MPSVPDRSRSALPVEGPPPPEPVTGSWGIAVAVDFGLGVCVAQGVRDGCGVKEGSCVRLGVSVGGSALGVLDAVLVCVCVGVAVIVGVSVGVPVAVPVAV